MYRKIYNLTEQTQKKLCVCGCGTKIQSIDKYGKERFYALNHHRKNKQSPNWKGGRILVSGYYYLFLPDHPYAIERGYYLEHRKVVEDNIGRILEPSEKVHHKDKNKKNNDISNLILYSSHGEHMRVEHKRKLDMSNRFCLLCGSKTTSFDKKSGGDKRYPKWLKYKEGFICRKCFDKNKKGFVKSSP